MAANPTPIVNPEIRHTKIFINNEFVNSVSGKTFPTINPATETKICDVQEGDKADIDIAVAAARKAFQLGSPWRQMDPAARGALLFKLADLLERDLIYFASLEAVDNGKPFHHAIGDMQFSLGFIRYYAGWCDKLQGKCLPVPNSFMCFTRHEPIGVVGGIIPWNYPLALCVIKTVTPLAVGCTVVVKPAEQTPLTALAFAGLVKEAGFPPGVINIVPGYGPTAGQSLVTHLDVAKISFTGSTEIGHLIMREAGNSSIKSLTLELGGKSPLIIFPDADLDEAAKVSHEAINVNMGQCCCACSRTFVHSSIYDEVVKRCEKLAKERKVGSPFEQTTCNGPQIDAEQMNKILSYCKSGVDEGAKLVVGGKRHGDKGYFIEPTLFVDVKDDMKIAKEEIFGPVQCIFKFDTIDEVIERANNTTYGLAASVFTKDLNTAMKMAQSLQAGTVWINVFNAQFPSTPFGGFKQSGFGKEMSEYALANYVQVKNVTMAIPGYIS